MRLVIVTGILSLSCCTAPPPEPDADSPVMAERLLALNERPWTTSPEDLAALIEQLDSDDPAVRMLAHDRLESLTGEDFGFRYDDRPDLREEAVERWSAWLRGRMRVAPHSDEPGEGREGVDRIDA